MALNIFVVELIVLGHFLHHNIFILFQMKMHLTDRNVLVSDIPLFVCFI